MSIGTGTDLGGTGLGGLGVGGSGPGDEPGTAPLPPPIDAPIRGRRIRLPRSPKIIAGLVMLAVFLIVAAIGPLVAPYVAQVRRGRANPAAGCGGEDRR